MELHNLTWLPFTRFSVSDIEDYNINGSFDPNAASDIEFYGYRETTFNVTCVESFYRTDNQWWPMSDDEQKEFLTGYDDQITLIVQNAIDDKQGEL